MPRGKPKGLLAMPFNTTVSIRNHLPLADLIYWMSSQCYMIFGTETGLLNLQSIDGLYCVGDSCFPGQGVIAVAFSGIMCAHRVAADIGKLILLCLSLNRDSLMFQQDRISHVLAARS
jgi:prolycopene isomerase